MFKIFQDYKSIEWILEQQDYIDFNPPYQRMGKIWNKEQKQLLIDSIFNGFDIPKLYFQFMPQNSVTYNYAVIDGKQRLEAILDFVNDEFPISENFCFVNEKDNNFYSNLAGKYFSEIDEKDSAIIANFFQYKLCIVFMDTDNPDIINETFIRLNSGIGVNTAEKRNASGGNLSLRMKELYSTDKFFTQKIKMTNARFAHFDLALKFLMLEMGYDNLAKSTVDKFVLENKMFDADCENALNIVKSKLNRFVEEFNDKDKLLVKKSLIVTLYCILDEIPIGKIKEFLNFFELNRKIAMEAEDKTTVPPEMIEFSRCLQQGADKKASLEERKNIMQNVLHIFLGV